MGDEVNAAVADAGPLIHLSQINALPLLRVFDTLHVPNAVWTETITHNRISHGDLVDLGIITRHTLPQPEVAQFIRNNHLESLQIGECECLCLCRQAGVTILLTDDLAARNFAKLLNLTPVGSLGIIVRAYRQGRLVLAEAERLIADLYDVSSLYVTRAIIELAIEQLRQASS